MSDSAALVLLSTIFVVLAYWLGKFIGAEKQRTLWQRHMERCNDYISAVDDVDRWCGHTSPHAKLIAAHIKAHGEGHGYNSGTPVKDEPCSPMGLRDQLRLIDAARLQHGSEKK